MKSFAKYSLMLVKDGKIPYECETILNTPIKVYELVKTLNIQESAEEEVHIICLDVKNKPIGTFMVSRGGLNQSIAHPREIFKRALLLNSSSIILAHNHPSGDSTPSTKDKITTKILVECGEMLGVNVIDHIIVGDDYRSLKEEGIL